MDDQVPSSSPLPPQNDKVIQSLTFFDALKEISNGKRVTKLEWADKNTYGILTNGILMINLSNGGLKAWTISDGDLTGTDWIVLE